LSNSRNKDVKESPYFKQVEFILQTIPHIAAETGFALKGGTAIYLFVRDMPRLSVDIDLAYLPVEEPRDTALNKISDALRRITVALKRTMPGVKAQESQGQGSVQYSKGWPAWQESSRSNRISTRSRSWSQTYQSERSQDHSRNKVMARPASVNFPNCQ